VIDCGFEGLVSDRIELSTGVTLHYVEMGEGPLVVMLHGFPEHWLSWRHQIPAVAAAGYRVVAPDMRGHNLSDKPPDVDDYYVEVLAKDVHALVEALGEEKAIVVAHDWGGAAAWFFAMLYPEQLERLVVLNMPHPLVFANAWSTLGQKIKSAYFYFFRMRRLAAFLFKLFGALGQRAMLWMFSGRKIRGETLKCYARAGKQPGAMVGMMSYYTALLARPPSAMTELVKPIAAPVDVIWGDKDPAFGKKLAVPPEDLVRDARIAYVEGAGHFVQSERSEEVTEKLLAALSRPAAKVPRSG